MRRVADTRHRPSCVRRPTAGAHSAAPKCDYRAPALQVCITAFCAAHDRRRREILHLRMHVVRVRAVYTAHQPYSSCAVTSPITVAAGEPLRVTSKPMVPKHRRNSHLDAKADFFDNIGPDNITDSVF